MQKKFIVIPSMAFRLAVVLALSSMLVSCSFGSMPTQPAVVDTAPTFQAIQTQSAMTVVAELTRTAPTVTPIVPTATQEQAAPTNTVAVEPTATFTSVPATEAVLPTATNTVVVATSTPAATATPANPICKIEEQRPGYGDDFGPNADFDGYWEIENTSDDTWYASNVDLKFIGGTKFQADDFEVRDMGVDVAPDDTVTIIIDMRAPSTAGRYNSAWALVQGGATLCSMSITIDVIQ